MNKVKQIALERKRSKPTSKIARDLSDIVEKIPLRYGNDATDRALGLTGYLKAHSSGKPATPRSPLFRGRKIEDVFSEWVAILKSHESEYPSIIQYDLSRLSKVGPQGALSPLEDRAEDLRAYGVNSQRALSLSKDALNTGIRNTRKELFSLTCARGRSLRPGSLKRVVSAYQGEDKLDTNSGMPLFRKRRNPESIKEAFHTATRLNDNIAKSYPAILGSRSSRKKSRFIFMFPMSTNLVEAQYVMPLMDEFTTVIDNRSMDYFSAGRGFSAVIRTLSRTLKKNGNGTDPLTCVSIDYTKMDTHMGPNQMTVVYELIRPFFQTGCDHGIRRSIENVNNIGVIIDEKLIARGPHGIASGSGGTNFAESMFSLLVHNQINTTLKQSDDIQLLCDQINGDDGIMIYRGAINDDEVKTVIANTSDQLGLHANEEKQDVSPITFHYLQRFFDVNYGAKSTLTGYVDCDRTDKRAELRGSYPTILALNAGMFPERFHDPEKWNARMEILRGIMILENCSYHPLFHEIIKFFMKGDKYRLGIDYPGFFDHLDSLYKEAKSIKGFVPSYNQQSINRGIGDFKVIKFLFEIYKKERKDQ